MRELLAILGVLGVLALAYGVWRVVMWLREPGPSDSNVIRGRKLLSYEEARSLAGADVERSADKRHYPWGGVPIAAKSALGHFAAVGSPGSGKTILLRMLVRSALQQMKEGERCIIFDMKGDYWRFINSHCGGGSFDARRDAMLVNPYSPETPAWDIAADSGIEEDGAVAAALLPLEASERNPHFVRGSRQLAKRVMAAFRKLGSEWTLWDLVVACSSAKHLRLLAYASGLDDLNERLSHKSQESGSLLGSLSTATDHLFVPAAIWQRSWTQGNRFALSDWLAGKGPRVLVLGYDTSKHESLQPLVQSILGHLIAKLLKEEEHEHAPKTWVFLDELPLAGRVESLADFLNTARSKGVATVIGTQSINMLSIPRLYPGPETAAILANPRNRAFLRTSDNETAQWMANQIGKREAYEAGFSSSEGWSQHGGRSGQGGTDMRVQERFLIHPDQFKDTPSPDEQNPLVGTFESFHGVWQCSIPPSQFPKRPQPEPPRSVSTAGLPESLEWTDADRKRLRLPKEEAPPRSKSADEKYGPRL